MHLTNYFYFPPGNNDGHRWSLGDDRVQVPVSGAAHSPSSPIGLEDSEKLARAFMWSTATQRCAYVMCVCGIGTCVLPWDPIQKTCVHVCACAISVILSVCT